MYSSCQNISNRHCFLVGGGCQMVSPPFRKILYETLGTDRPKSCSTCKQPHASKAVPIPINSFIKFGAEYFCHGKWQPSWSPSAMTSRWLPLYGKSNLGGCQNHPHLVYTYLLIFIFCSLLSLALGFPTHFHFVCWTL